jgi:peptide deformylase
VAILKVAKLGSPILRKRAAEIETHDLKKGRFRTFFEDMMETMVEYRGTGLAAPQVSTGLRAVLYEVHAEKRGKDVLEVPPTLLVNPSFEVLDADEVEDFEACLSVPFLAAKVPRPKKIKVTALDPSGKPVSFVADGFHARVVLHESDHLDGVVYLDRVKDRASIRYTVDF